MNRGQSSTYVTSRCSSPVQSKAQNAPNKAKKKHRETHLVVLLEARVLGGEGLPRGVPLASFGPSGGGRALRVVLPDVLAALLEVAALRAPALSTATHPSRLSQLQQLLLFGRGAGG
jgi:hypothetical protein